MFSFWMEKIRIQDKRPGWFKPDGTRGFFDPGSGMDKFGSWIRKCNTDELLGKADLH